MDLLIRAALLCQRGSARNRDASQCRDSFCAEPFTGRFGAVRGNKPIGFAEEARLVRRLTLSAPNETDTDSADVIAMIEIIVDALKFLEKPFISVAQIQIRLIV
jgi:hypothetical protein